MRYEEVQKPHDSTLSRMKERVERSRDRLTPNFPWDEFDEYYHRKQNLQAPIPDYEREVASMEDFIPWLTSTFGSTAPDVAASMGFEPPAMDAMASAPGLGSLLEPKPMMGAPMDGAPGVGVPPGTGTGGLDALTRGLRGMVPPTVPTPQRVATPAAPRMNDIKGGELLQLLMLANAGGDMSGGRKLQAMPSTLGQALNVPRY